LFAGAAGNILDRLYLGWVRDRIDLGFFPVFNLADVYITLWGVILLYSEFYTSQKKVCEKK
jgi:signal peptidase II